MNTDGTVVVRSSSDYIPKMIDIAGGKYIFQDLKEHKKQECFCGTVDGRVLCKSKECRLSDL